MKSKRLKCGLIILISTLILLNSIGISSFFDLDDKITYNPDINIYISLNEIRIPNEIYDIKFPLTSKVANEPNLTRVGYPLIIRMNESPYVFSALGGLNESYIRVLYYNASNQWVEVPYQIDEKGWPLMWDWGMLSGPLGNPLYDPIFNSTHTYVSKNGTDNYEPIDLYGRDTGTQVPYAIDYDDEICFYMENGRYVGENTWWDRQNFPWRLEINISDPIDGGVSFMYIYFNNITKQEIPTFQTKVSWDPSNLTVTTPIYQKRFNNNDPDIIDSLKIIAPGSDGVDVVYEMDKGFTGLHLERACSILSLDAIDIYKDIMTYGTWGGTYYNTRGTGIDNPNEYAIQLSLPPNQPGWNGWDTEGDRLAVKNGPVRVILQKNSYEQAYLTNIPIVGDVEEWYIEQSVHIFYQNMEQGDKDALSITAWGYNFLDVGMWLPTVQFDNATRTDFSAILGGNPGGYPGYVPADANPDYPVGSEKYIYFSGTDADDNLLNGGDPTTDPPTIPPSGNEGIADYIMVTSETHGGMWMYLPRQEMIPSFELYGGTPYMYLNDIQQFGELGWCATGFDIPDGSTLTTDPYYFRIVYDLFDNVSDVDRAELEYRRYKTDLSNPATTPISYKLQSAPPIPYPIFEYVTPSSLSCKNGSTIDLIIDTNFAGLNVTVDWSRIDSNGGTAESTTDLGNTQYINNHTISMSNTRFDSNYLVNITAKNETSGISVYSHVYLELDNTPPTAAQPIALPPITRARSILIDWSGNPGYDDPGIGNATGSGIDYYVLWRSTSSGGPYTTLVTNTSGTINTSVLDNNIQDGDTYYYVLETFDKVGFVSTSSEVWTTVYFPPRLENLTEITDPVEFGQEACIRIDAYDNETSVDTVIIKIINANYTMNPIGGNTYEYNWTPSLIGVIEYTIFANDTIDGYWNFLNNSITVQDITPPNLLAGAPDITLELGAVAGYTLEWDWNDLFPNEYNITLIGTYLADGTWSVGTNITYTLPALGIGTYEYMCGVNDTSGNWVSDNVTVTVPDPSPPNLLAGAPDITLELGAVAGYQLQWDWNDLEPNLYNITLVSTYLADGTWSVGTNITYTLPALGLGVYEYMCGVNDTSGDWGTDNVTVTVVDSTPPNLLAGAPDAWLPLGSVAGYVLEWDWNDLLPNEYNITLFGSVVVDGTWAVGTNITYTLPALGPGVYEYMCGVNDTAGNWAWDNVTVTVPDPDPKPDLLAGAPDVTLELGSVAGYVLEWAWTDVDPSKYNITLIGTYLADGSWSVGTNITYTLPALGIGTYDYRCNVNDTAGNWAWDNVMVTVEDSTPPNLVAGAPNVIFLEGSVAGYMLEWDWNDVAPNEYNITLIGSYIADGSWSVGTNVTYTLPALALGTYEYMCGVNDSSGNWAWANVTVTVDCNCLPLLLAGAPDVTLELGAVAGYVLEWNWSTYKPDRYNITLVGSVVDSGGWVSGINITYTLPVLGLGTYNYMCTVNETFGYSTWASDNVTVTVVDTTPPNLVAGAPDIILNEGFVAGYTLEWAWNDLLPNEYNITLIGSYLADGTWSVGTNVTYTLPALGLGVYEFMCGVNDTSGNWAWDNLTVAVANLPLIPFLSAVTPDITLELGAVAGYQLQWNWTDTNPNEYNITLVDNYLADGTWLVGTNVTYTLPVLGLGVYEYMCSVNDTFGNWAWDNVTVTVVDRTAPNLLAGALDITLELGAVAGYTLEWDWNDLLPNEYNITLIDTYLTDGTWSVGTNVTYTLPALGPGIYDYMCGVNDTSGNWAWDNVTVTVEPFNIPPTLLAGAMDITLELGAVAGYQLQWAWNDLNPNEYNITLIYTYLADGTWSVGTNITYTLPALGLGTYNYMCAVNDTTDLWATDNVTVTVVDSMNPNLVTGAPDITLSEGSVAGYNLEWNWNDLLPNEYNITLIGIYMGDGTWSVGTNITYTLPMLGPGVYEYMCGVNDTSGNWAWDNVTVTVLESIPPNLLAGAPDINLYEGSVAGYQLQWNWTDATPNEYNITIISTYLADGTWSVGTNVTYTLPALGMGVYVYICGVNDTFGYSSSDNVTVTVLIPPAPPTLLAGAPDITLELGAVAGYTLEWEWNDISPNEYNITLVGTYLADGTWSVGTNITYTLPALGIGTYDYRCSVNDTAGNWATDNVTVTVVDTTPPSIINLTMNWSNATVISDDSSGWNDWTSWYPAIATDNNGNIHVVWEDNTDGEWGTDVEIMYVNYTVAGWSNVTVISDDYTGWNDDSSRRPRIAVDNNGNIHVVWYDSTNGEYGNDIEIMYVNYTAAGWSNATVISDDYTGWNVHNSLNPDIAVDNNGNVHVVWYDDTDGEWGTDVEIMYVNYTATGWSNVTCISDYYGWNDNSSYYPRISTDINGNVHVVWMDYTYGEWGTDREIFYANCTAAGWSNATCISDIYGWNDGDSFLPCITVDKTGNLQVVWDDETDGEWGTDREIFYVNYTAAGWSNATCISDIYGLNDYWSFRPSIITDKNDNIHVVWEDSINFGGPADHIKYASYTTAGWSNVICISDYYGWNNDHSIAASITSDNNSSIHVVWHDYTNGEWGTDEEIMYSVLESIYPLELGQPKIIDAVVYDLSSIIQVLIEFEGSNHTMTNIGGNYWRYDNWTPNSIGNYPYTIWAEDGANNWNSRGATIEVIDTTSPTYGNLTESADPLDLGQNETITINVSDLSGINQVLLEYEGSNHTMNYISGNTWRWTDWQPSAIGIYPYTVYMSDNLNNWNSVSGDINVSIIITIEPWLENLTEITDPLELGQEASIRIDAYDADGISKVIIEIGGVNDTMVPIGGNTYEYNWTPSAFGVISYTIIANDTFNNWGPFFFSSITVQDNTPPTKPLNPGIIIQQGNVTISWTASFDYSTVYYQIWRNGQCLGNTTSNFYSDLINLTSGKYSYEIRPVDEANNTGESLYITIKIYGPFKIPPFFPPYDNIIIIIIIIGVVAAGVGISTSAILLRKRQKSISKRVVSSESLNEDIKDVIHWRMPIKSIKQTYLKEYFQGEFTILSKSEMDRIFDLKIPEIEKLVILEELAGLSPEEREEFLKAMENIEEE